MCVCAGPTPTSTSTNHLCSMIMKHPAKGGEKAPSLRPLKAKTWPHFLLRNALAHNNRGVFPFARRFSLMCKQWTRRLIWDKAVAAVDGVLRVTPWLHTLNQHGRSELQKLALPHFDIAFCRCSSDKNNAQLKMLLFSFPEPFIWLGCFRNHFLLLCFNSGVVYLCLHGYGYSQQHTVLFLCTHYYQGSLKIIIMQSETV